MGSDRKRAVLAGVFFIVAAFPAMAALALYHPVLHNSRFIVEASGHDSQVLLGAFLEVLVAISVAGTAVTLFPVLRRQGSHRAVGYLVGRVVVAALIVIGLLSLVIVVLLRHDPSGLSAGHAASLIGTGRALVEVHKWTFLLGPSFAIGVNTALLASVMYQSQLIPRTIARIGLVAGPLIFVSSIAIVCGAYAQTSTVAGLAAIPVFVWEMALAVWLIAKGFKSPRHTAQATRPIKHNLYVAAA